MVVQSSEIMAQLHDDSLQALDLEVGRSVGVHVLCRDHQAVLVVVSQQQVAQEEGLQAGHVQTGDSLGQFRPQTLDAVGHALVQLRIVPCADVNVVSCGQTYNGRDTQITAERVFIEWSRSLTQIFGEHADHRETGQKDQEPHFIEIVHCRMYVGPVTFGAGMWIN